MANIEQLIKSVAAINNCTLSKDDQKLNQYTKEQLKTAFNNKKIEVIYDLVAEGPKSNPIDNSEREPYYSELDSLVEECGLDILAWYLPYHIYPDDWGIYIPIESISFIAEKHLGGNTLDNLKTAYRILLHHEHYHYLYENLISRWELRLGNPCYIYNQLKPYNQSEELLANAYMIKKMNKEECIKEIKAFCRKMPKGYRDFGAAKTNHGKRENELKLIKQYIGLSVLSVNRYFPWDSGINLDYSPDHNRPDFEKNCRVFLLRKKGQIAFNQLGFITNIGHLDEEKKFKKKVEKYGLKKKWERIKNELIKNISNGRDFKKYFHAGEDIFSIRIDRSNRAHLRNDGHRWTAIDIGPHTKMGHG